MASLDDIFTTQKNGVVAINSLVKYIQNISNKVVGSQLFQGPTTTSASIVYSTDVNTTAYLTEINISNTAATGATFSVYVVPFGTSPGAGNALFYQSPINGNTTVLWQGAVLIPPNSSVQIQASTTTINIFVTGNTVA